MSFDPVVFDKVEVMKRMVSRLLLQFQGAPVLIDILNAFGLELQLLLDTVGEVIVERSPLDAVEQQLEGLGRIVGQDRIVIDYEDVTWFSPDVVGLGADVAPVWVTGVVTAGSLLADDIMYRQLIEAKVFRNFTKYGSVPENQTVALVAFGVDVSWKLTGPMSVNIFISENTNSAVTNILTDTLHGGDDALSIMPYPPTLSIDNIIFSPVPSFAPDTENGADVGKAAVFRPL